MDTQGYKYDVAFSFLKEDEELATQLNQLLEGRLKTFLYSKKQAEIAGTDGEKAFSRVFGSEARIVVVLYRSTWGSSSWTRIEETAIKNRAYDEGYDFTVFIPLEEGAALPKWLPRTRLWVGLKKWGIQGAASAIELRVQELGGEPKEESFEEKARRLDREVQADRERKRFLDSDEGVRAAGKEVKSLFAELGKLAEQVSKDASSFKCATDQDDSTFVVFGPGYTLWVHWSVTYGNTLDGSRLLVRIFRGAIGFKGRMPWEEPQLLEDEEFFFDCNESKECRWHLDSQKMPQRTTQELAEYCLEALITKICEERLSAPR